MTEVKSGPGFRNAAGSRLVAVMRRNGSLAADYARRHGVPRWYDSAEALIDDPAVDAVYVATPPDSHAHYALMAASAGKPAYVEKPMARHGAECDQMVDAFARADLPLFVAYYRRRLPCFVKVRDVIDSGSLGHVTGITYRFADPMHLKGLLWRVDASQAGAGFFLDLASHVLDLMDFFFGPLSDACGTAANTASSYDVEDAVALSFRTPGGALGSMAFNFAGAVHDDTLRICGTEGEIQFPVFRSEPFRWEDASGVRPIDLPYPPHVGQPLIQTVVDDLLGAGECPSTGESARRTTRIMDRVLEAYYGGRTDAFWTRPQTWPGRRKS